MIVAMGVMLIGGFSGALMISGAISGILILIGILLLIIYFIFVIINSLRLTVSTAIYVREDIGIGDALKKAWDMSEECVGKIFVAMLAFGIVMGIIVAVVTGPATMYLVSGIVSNVGSEINTLQPNMFGEDMDMETFEFTYGFNPTNKVNNIIGQAMADPIYNILLIPSYIVQALMIAAGSFFVVALYNAMKANKIPINSQQTKSPPQNNTQYSSKKTDAEKGLKAAFG
jgi:large-conductance mechanosensitive channel